MKILYPLLFIAILFSACNQSTEEETDSAEGETSSDNTQEDIESGDLSELERGVAGNWEALRLDIDIANGDSISNVVYPATEFPEQLGIKNNYTSYNEDGTFLSRYVLPNGEVMMEEGGTWRIDADSLYVYYESADFTYAYDYRLSGDTIFWSAIYDWDQDGEMDDLTRGVAIRSTAPYFE